MGESQLGISDDGGKMDRMDLLILTCSLSSSASHMINALSSADHDDFATLREAFRKNYGSTGWEGLFEAEQNAS